MENWSLMNIKICENKVLSYKALEIKALGFQSPRNINPWETEMLRTLRTGENRIWEN